jgi:predicted Zn-dependent protease
VLPDPAGPVLGMEAEPWLPVRGISYWSPPDVTMGDHLVYGQWLPEPEPPHRGRTFLKITAIVAAAATAVVGVQALRGMFDIDPLSVPKLGGQVAAQGELPEGYSLLSDADLYPSHLVCGATTWELVGEASSVPPGGQEALAQAVELVEELSGVDLLEADSVSSRTKVGTPITIQFVPTDEVQDMAEGRSGDTVGVASTQRTIQGIVEADIYLDQDWFDLALRRQHDEAVLVIVHEFGHALGLGHAEDAQSVMYPQGSASTRLLSSDVEAFRAVLPDCG